MPFWTCMNAVLSVRAEIAAKYILRRFAAPRNLPCLPALAKTTVRASRTLATIWSALMTYFDAATRAAVNASRLRASRASSYCDRTAGHNSLHSCFESEHGAHCSTCMKEAFFAQEMTAKGKTPAQIRAAIIKGDFEKVDLQKFNQD